MNEISSLSAYSKTDPDIEYYQALVEAIKSKDSTRVRKTLDLNITFPPIENVFHYLCNQQPNSNLEVILYMLVDYGFQIDAVDEKGNTCLYYAVLNKNVSLCEVLLQCGADMWADTQLNISVLSYVIEKSAEPIQNIFDKYYPGLWKAVEWQDIDEVRKLINLWCRTDLYQDGVSLKNIALNSGNEEIISLILGIFETMKLIYHIRARNIKAVSELLAKKQHKVRLNLRKMSDRGAPILYYLIQSCDLEVIELFVNCGCPLYTIMRDDQHYDMPVLFSALKPETPLSVMEALLPQGQPHQEEMLFRIIYKSRTVLEVALEERVTPDVFGLLIERGGPLLICERNQFNQTIRDLAISSSQTKYIDVIDKSILSWILHPEKYPKRRQNLVLYGWNFTPLQERFPQKFSDEDFNSYAKIMQRGINHLCRAVEEGNLEEYFTLKASLTTTESPENFLWNAKVVGDGVPLLHRAVLHNQLEIVNDILVAKPINESIDSLFDQNRRTALHYTYGSSEMKEIRKLLNSYGCSEHVLDKVNREPLDFRDQRDTPAMIQLMERLKLKNYDLPEPDPWLVEGCSNKPHELCYCQPSEEDILPKEEDEDSEEEEEEDHRSFCLVS